MVQPKACCRFVRIPPRLVIAMLLACYSMFGMSLVASLIIITLIWSRLAHFGSSGSARVPTLWFYTENDSFFGPALSKRMYDAWTAAGGIADGRGLAAALMLGADGVLVGTRLWASSEALVKEGHHRAILETDGDGTLRTRIPDIARQIPWPRGFTARIRRNAVARTTASSVR